MCVYVLYCSVINPNTAEESRDEQSKETWKDLLVVYFFPLSLITPLHLLLFLKQTQHSNHIKGFRLSQNNWFPKYRKFYKHNQNAPGTMEPLVYPKLNRFKSMITISHYMSNGTAYLSLTLHLHIKINHKPILELDYREKEICLSSPEHIFMHMRHQDSSSAINPSEPTLPNFASMVFHVWFIVVIAASQARIQIG